jgi:hypothetical protein
VERGFLIRPDGLGLAAGALDAWRMLRGGLKIRAPNTLRLARSGAMQRIPDFS